jgi:hypothetical protein
VKYREFKFVVQAVMLTEDDEGACTGEATSEPIALYGLAALRAWVDSFPDELAALNKEP